MGDFIIVTGDKAIFLPPFGSAIVAVQPGTMIGGSPSSTLEGKKVCHVGDEKKVMVPGCAYIEGPHVIPGVGMLKIKELGGDQKTKKTTADGKKLILKGSMFKAEFHVMAPAMKPNPPGPPVPDPKPIHKGQGMFVTMNMKWTTE